MNLTLVKVSHIEVEFVHIIGLDVSNSLLRRCTACIFNKQFRTSSAANRCTNAYITLSGKYVKFPYDLSTSAEKNVKAVEYCVLNPPN